MKILNIKTEDFINYKKPSMFIGMGSCDFKCCKESGIPPESCHNYILDDYIELDPKTIVGNYLSNSISEAIVIGGLEPFNDFDNLLELVKEFRQNTDDDIVIYSGYYPDEISEYIYKLNNFKNIIVKFGRFIPNKSSYLNKLLGVELVSDNQFAKKLPILFY